MEANFEGVSVKFEDCGHCKASPTQEEVLAAVLRAKEDRVRRAGCAFCGETIKATSFRVEHIDGVWKAYEKEIEPAISLRVQPQHKGEIPQQNGLHLRCVKKALPYLRGLEQ